MNVLSDQEIAAWETVVAALEPQLTDPAELKELEELCRKNFSPKNLANFLGCRITGLEINMSRLTLAGLKQAKKADEEVKELKSTLLHLQEQISALKEQAETGTSQEAQDQIVVLELPRYGSTRELAKARTLVFLEDNQEALNDGAGVLIDGSNCKQAGISYLEEITSILRKKGLLAMMTHQNLSTGALSNLNWVLDQPEY